MSFASNYNTVKRIEELLSRAQSSGNPEELWRIARELRGLDPRAARLVERLFVSRALERADMAERERAQHWRPMIGDAVYVLAVYPPGEASVLDAEAEVDAVALAVPVSRLWQAVLLLEEEVERLENKLARLHGMAAERVKKSIELYRERIRRIRGLLNAVYRGDSLDKVLSLLPGCSADLLAGAVRRLKGAREGVMVEVSLGQVLEGHYTKPGKPVVVLKAAVGVKRVDGVGGRVLVVELKPVVTVKQRNRLSRRLARGYMALRS